jgi:hemoglobin-like flavoprotein
VKQSGLGTPKALAQALIETYDIRFDQEHTAALVKRRKYTKITPELRDQIKALLKKQSMNRVAEELQISYAVIAKVANGAYDRLK